MYIHDGSTLIETSLNNFRLNVSDIVQLGYDNNFGSGNTTYEMQAGNLSVGTAIRIVGKGIFEQTGGSVSASTISIAADSSNGLGTYSGTGNYFLSGGALQCTELKIGNSNINSFGALFSFSCGSITVSDVTLANGGGFNQSGTSNYTISNNLNIGTGSAYNLSNGTLIVSQTLDNYGTFIQTKGATLVESTASYSVVNEIGATYTLSGGTLASFSLISGGVFNQSNGTTNTIVGTFYNYAGGNYTLSGANSTLTTNNSLGDAVAINNGTFTETGGTASFYNLSGNGTFSLSGGNLLLSGSNNSLNSLSFTFNGGTLQTNANISTSAPFSLISAGGTLSPATSKNLTLSGNITGNGTLHMAGAGTLTLSGNNTYSGGTTINTGGTLILASTAALPSGSNVTNNGTLAVNANATTGTLSGTGTTNIASATTLTANANITQSNIVNLGTLTLANSSNATLTSNITGTGGITKLNNGTVTLGGLVSSGTLGTPIGTVNVSCGTLKLADTAATRQTSAIAVDISNLTIGTGATLDIGNHDLIIRNGNYQAIDALVGQGFGASQDWNGTGITSSDAANSPTGLNAVGVGVAGDLGYTSFDGIPVNAGDVLVKYTFFGDANLDGQVDGNDFTLWQLGFGSTAADQVGWSWATLITPTALTATTLRCGSWAPALA